MFFYKTYPCSKKATTVSVIFSLLAFMFVITGIMLFREALSDKEYVNCAIAVVIAAVGIPIYIFGSNKLSKKIAEKEGPKNIRTKVGYAHKYVMAHPEAYDWLIKENPAFAAKYVRNESGQIVKRR